MENILEAFGKITTLVFDVDGVITDGTVQVLETGEQFRTFNIKDGWAINRAVKEGFNVIIISAGNNEGVRKRLEYLGVKEINLAVPNKLALLAEYKQNLSLKDDEILYMGDDMPDFEVMHKVGLPVCPADAASDIINIAKYISPKDGGKGAVRDVLEKVLKIQDKWPKHENVQGVNN